VWPCKHEFVQQLEKQTSRFASPVSEDIKTTTVAKNFNWISPITKADSVSMLEWALIPSYGDLVKQWSNYVDPNLIECQLGSYKALCDCTVGSQNKNLLASTRYPAVIKCKAVKRSYSVPARSWFWKMLIASFTVAEVKHPQQTTGSLTDRWVQCTKLLAHQSQLR
jgi:hypothetical protein